MRYQPRDKDIVWEVSEGEVLLIDLVKCVYFSARNGTTQLVHDLLHGHSSDEIVARWVERHPQGESNVREHLQAVILMFTANDLIKVLEQDPPRPGIFLELESVELTEVEYYEDMKEIFEMDPIHDGDLERGWPVHN